MVRFTSTDINQVRLLADNTRAFKDEQGNETYISPHTIEYGEVQLDGWWIIKCKGWEKERRLKEL